MKAAIVTEPRQAAPNYADFPATTPESQHLTRGNAMFISPATKRCNRHTLTFVLQNLSITK